MTTLLAAKQQAMSLLAGNRLAEAKAACLHAAKGAPDDADLLYLLGLICARQGDFPQATQWAAKAVTAQPNNPRAHVLMGNILLQQQKLGEAKSHYEAALSAQPDAADAHYYLASILSTEGVVNDAEHHFRESARLQPNHADSHANLGMVLEVLHRLAEARASASTALALNPSHTGALLLLAKLEKREKNYSEAASLLEKVITPSAHPSLVATAAIELGHARDKLGQFDAAFAAYTRGKNAWSLLAGKAGFDRHFYPKRIAQYRDWFTTERVTHWSEQPAPAGGRGAPIFFVGFPRSGTTLMEQVLRQHPGVRALDEKPLIKELVDELPELTGAAGPYPDCLAALTAQQVEALRAEYWRKVDHLLGEIPIGVHVVDKFPLNMVELGFIHRIFPESKILVAIRDPRDACLSCFMQGFVLNPAMINFLSLDSTTRFYAEVMGLFRHYRSVLPLRAHTYRYEDLVGNFEQTTRGIFGFLGIEWTDKLADFHADAQKRYISTPSYQEVTRPVHREATARWKHYQTHLAPYLDRLASSLRDFGYE